MLLILRCLDGHAMSLLRCFCWIPFVGVGDGWVMIAFGLALMFSMHLEFGLARLAIFS